MGDCFDGVREAVGKVVRRVDAPIPVRSVMWRLLLDAIDHRVPQVEVGGSHVYLGSERFRAIGKFPVFHPLEKVEVFGTARNDPFYKEIPQ